MPERSLRSGEVAARAGVNVETLRYYERRGLLKEPRRRPSGYRCYPPEAVLVVRFIKRAQELGFTLDECEELLVLRGARTLVCDDARAAAVEKVEQIQEKIRDLQRMKRALNELVRACDEEQTTTCPILEALDSETRGRSS